MREAIDENIASRTRSEVGRVAVPAGAAAAVAVAAVAAVRAPARDGFLAAEADATAPALARRHSNVDLVDEHLEGFGLRALGYSGSAKA